MKYSRRRGHLTHVALPLEYSPLQRRHDGRDKVLNHQTVYSKVYSSADQRNTKAPRQWPLGGEFAGDRWIPCTNGQWRGNCFHLMTSSCLDDLQPHFVASPDIDSHGIHCAGHTVIPVSSMYSKNRDDLCSARAENIIAMANMVYVSTMQFTTARVNAHVGVLNRK